MPEDPRVTTVDDMICDLIVALSLKRNKDWNVQRRLIERYVAAIIAYCDETPSFTVTASGSLKLNA